MAAEKTIIIDERPVKFRASAAVPRLYRARFGRDIFKDLMELDQAVKAADDEPGSSMGIDSLEMFENVSYIMAKHADPHQPETPEEWLDQFETFSIYAVLPEILELWKVNNITVANAKKKPGPAAVK